MKILSLNSGIRYTHIRVNRGLGDITFRGGSKWGQKCPKMAQNRHISRYNNKTKQLLSIKVCPLLFLGPKQAKSDYFSEIGVPV